LSVDSRICASVFPQTSAEAVKLIDRAKEAGANLVEVRLDSLKTHEGLAEVAKHGKIQKIATNRLMKNKGKFSGTETQQKQILLSAAKGGFDYVDIELSASNLKEFTTKQADSGPK